MRYRVSRGHTIFGPLVSFDCDELPPDLYARFPVVSVTLLHAVPLEALQAAMKEQETA